MASWAQKFVLVIAGAAAVADAAPAKRQVSSVVADLGYTLHQGNLVDNAYGRDYYRFANIQYASAKRFGAPSSPPTNRTTVQNGSVDISCASFSPSWNTAAGLYLSGQTPVWPNITAANAGTPPVGAQDDCLYLDMLVPRDVYGSKQALAPVMLYIHGGGYASGDKNGDRPGNGYEGSGFMTRSNGSVIFITIGYRDGLFGWLAGPSYQKQGGTPNLGLRDQRAALEWVQKYITRFGGDPDNVLIFGESAGGGSVMHQMIAYGGAKGTPFKRALPQSPWHQPIDAQKAESVYQQVLKTANATNIEQLAQLDYESMWTVNAIVIGNARPFSTFNFGPTVDGDILPDTYANLFNQGRFSRDIQLMVGHNSDEGAVFTSPFIKTDAAYLSWLRASLPGANASTVAFVNRSLYPASSYPSEYSRLDATVGDFSVDCNAYLMSIAVNQYNGPAHNFAYLFSVPPGTHAEDIGYTEYSEGFSDPNSVNVTIAEAMQRYFVNFAKTGDPNSGGNGLATWPTWQETRFLREMNFNTTGIAPIPADNVNKRCEWWAQGKYLSP